MRLKRSIILALLFGSLLAVPAPARADWIFTPYVGANFGGDTPDTSLSVGSSLGYMGAGIIGFEVDFGYALDFWNDPNTNAFDSNVTSLMANLIVGVPVGGQGRGVRPYVSGGAGLLRSRVDDVEDFFDVTENSFGINAGGGIMGFISDNVGIRGDIRYFRSIKDDDGLDLDIGSFDFWRASVGVAFRF